MKIRHYGILGNAQKKKNLELSRKYLKKENTELDLKTQLPVEESTAELLKRVCDLNIFLCKKCSKGQMIPITYRNYLNYPFILS
jgi:hypothetical protein